MAKKLLVADDSITIQKVISLTFAQEDFVIQSVSNGDQAIEKVREMMPDIVLADVFMPGRNGYEVCAAIKGDPDLSQIPVILLVGTFEPFDEAEAVRVKFDGHLTKPFDSGELVELVRSLIDRGQPETKPLTAEKRAQAVGAAASTSHLVSTRTRDSFLGSESILDLFDPSTIAAPRTADISGAAYPAVSKASVPEAEAASSPVSPGQEQAKAAESVNPQVIPFPGLREVVSSGAGAPTISDEIIDVIVEKVVRRLSQEVVREIAWDVVPQLAETMIREYLNKHGVPDSSPKLGS